MNERYELKHWDRPRLWQNSGIEWLIFQKKLSNGSIMYATVSNEDSAIKWDVTDSAESRIDLTLYHDEVVRGARARWGDQWGREA